VTSDSVRKLFPQLLRNGYVPIPNRNKHCYLPKWPSIGVDEEQCRKWTRQTRWPAIGLRVEPPLLVFDYDIPDAGILKAIEDITPSVIFDGLERIGSAPKTAIFLRMSERDEPFREMHTRRYHFIGVPKPSFAVQAFAGGGGGAQMGSFGPHSHDEHGNVIKTYSWVGGRSPATVPLCDLPELTRSEVAAHLDEIDRLLAGWPGLVVDEKTTAGESGQMQVYDLNDEMVFVDSDGSEYSLEEMIAHAKALKELGQPHMRITGSFTGDEASSGSPRCKVHWNKLDGVSVVDFKTGITHHPVGGAEDPKVQEMLSTIFTKGFGR